MELDELKAAWKDLERRVEASEAATLQLRHAAGRTRVGTALRNIAWGQGFQALVGVGVAVVAARFWVEHRETPHLLVSGLVMHAYALLTIAMSVRQLLLVATADHAAPVVELQRKLALLRRARLQTQLLLGLPMWMLWVVATLVGTRWLAGVDIYAAAPGWVLLSLAVGALGMVLTLWLPWRYARGPRGARFLQRRLDELAHFRHE